MPRNADSRPVCRSHRLVRLVEGRASRSTPSRKGTLHCGLCRSRNYQYSQAGPSSRVGRHTRLPPGQPHRQPRQAPRRRLARLGRIHSYLGTRLGRPHRPQTSGPASTPSSANIRFRTFRLPPLTSTLPSALRPLISATSTDEVVARAPLRVGPQVLGILRKARQPLSSGRAMSPPPTPDRFEDTRDELRHAARAFSNAGTRASRHPSGAQRPDSTSEGADLEDLDFWHIPP